MDLETLHAVLLEVADAVERDRTVWHLHRAGVRMACVTDPRFDRMRVVAPIVATSEMDEEQRVAVLDANFHTALDARYATSDGILYAAFIHPLSPLTEGELRSAVAQVATLARTFGTTYSSGALVFGGGGSPRGPMN